jgi:hypothetical protein
VIADCLPRSVQTCVTKKLRSVGWLTCEFPTDQPVQTRGLPRLMLSLSSCSHCLSLFFGRFFFSLISFFFLILTRCRLVATSHNITLTHTQAPAARPSPVATSQPHHHINHRQLCHILHPSSPPHLLPLPIVRYVFFLFYFILFLFSHPSICCCVVPLAPMM